MVDLTFQFLGNSLKNYLIALGIFLLVILILKIFKNLGVKKLKKLVDHTRTEFDDLIINIVDSIGWPFYFIIALYLSSKFLNLVPKIEKAFYYLLILGVTYYAVRGGQEIVNFFSQKLIEKRKKEDEKFEPQTINLLSGIVKGILWVVAVILVLQNFGYNISTLIAGLGIGGVAVAFALQNILGDIFASFSIYFDKPFKVGDYIVIGEDRGRVKKIGIKTTRIQSIQGEELIISNKELTEKRVKNYGRIEKRRVSFLFGICYETPLEKVKMVPKILEEILKKEELVEIDRIHFKEFGDFSLNFEAVFFFQSRDYKAYLDAQQRIYLKLMEKFSQEGIEFAYPTQTIFLQREGKKKES